MKEILLGEWVGSVSADLLAGGDLGWRETLVTFLTEAGWGWATSELTLVAVSDTGAASELSSVAVLAADVASGIILAEEGLSAKHDSWCRTRSSGEFKTLSQFLHLGNGGCSRTADDRGPVREVPAWVFMCTFKLQTLLKHSSHCFLGLGLATF